MRTRLLWIALLSTGLFCTIFSIAVTHGQTIDKPAVTKPSTESLPTLSDKQKFEYRDVELSKQEAVSRLQSAIADVNQANLNVYNKKVEILKSMNLDADMYDIDEKTLSVVKKTPTQPDKK